jgi:signal transduction histidine kinase
MFIHKTDFKKPSGESVRFEIHATIVNLEDDRRSILFIARDITERKRLEQEMHEMSERVRQQVGQDLHDDLGPHLIGIEALTEVVKHKLEQKKSPEAEEVEKIRMLINRAIMKTQRLMRGLCPVDLDSKGLLSAITNVTVIVSNIWKVSCRFHYDHTVAVEDNAIATNLYYIVKEAAYNAARHSGAKNIIINLKHRKSGLVIEVVDDGSGISVAARKHPGMGLRIMRYRAELINGTFVIRRNKPTGTLVLCTVPGI